MLKWFDRLCLPILTIAFMRAASTLDGFADHELIYLVLAGLLGGLTWELILRPLTRRLIDKSP